MKSDEPSDSKVLQRTVDIALLLLVAAAFFILLGNNGFIDGHDIQSYPY